MMDVDVFALFPGNWLTDKVQHHPYSRQTGISLHPLYIPRESLRF